MRENEFIYTYEYDKKKAHEEELVVCAIKSRNNDTGGIHFKERKWVCRVNDK